MQFKFQFEIQVKTEKATSKIIPGIRWIWNLSKLQGRKIYSVSEKVLSLMKGKFFKSRWGHLAGMLGTSDYAVTGPSLWSSPRQFSSGLVKRMQSVDSEGSWSRLSPTTYLAVWLGTHCVRFMDLSFFTCKIEIALPTSWNCLDFRRLNKIQWTSSLNIVFTSKIPSFFQLSDWFGNQWFYNTHSI